MKAPYCEEHHQGIGHCTSGDPACRVCGCGGLCDSGIRCPMARPPTNEERAAARCPICHHARHPYSICSGRMGGTAWRCCCKGGTT